MDEAMLESSEKELRDACGVAGAVLAHDVDPSTWRLGPFLVDALLNLQHRGTESSGVVGSNLEGPKNHSHHFVIHKGIGLVRNVFTDECLEKFSDCRLMVGHNRYSTAGLKDAINCVQPFVVHTLAGLVAVSHNGELVNATHTRAQVLRRGVGLSTDTDSELIAQMIAHEVAKRRNDPGEPAQGADGIVDELKAVVGQLTLSYSLLVAACGRLYAVRDPYGNRPLSVGVIEFPDKLVNGEQQRVIAYVAASESCALARAKQVHDVLPGQIVELSPENGIRLCATLPAPAGLNRMAFCVFEYIYFSRPDSVLNGSQVHRVRQRCGERLALEAPCPEADLVSNVPDSANPSAIGYAMQAGIAYLPVLCKNSYVGRTFIQPSPMLREAGVSRKFGALAENFAGRRVVLVDDSIVRGNTMRPIVRLLKDNGAKEVHIRIASPPVRHACYMGINIPCPSELIAHKLPDEADICAHVGADSLRYLSLDGLVAAVDATDQDQHLRLDQPAENTRLCLACLDGRYPVQIDKRLSW